MSLCVSPHFYHVSSPKTEQNFGLPENHRWFNDPIRSRLSKQCTRRPLRILVPNEEHRPSQFPYLEMHGRSSGRLYEWDTSTNVCVLYTTHPSMTIIYLHFIHAAMIAMAQALRGGFSIEDLPKSKSQERISASMQAHVSNKVMRLRRCVPNSLQVPTSGTKMKIWQCLDIPAQRWIYTGDNRFELESTS